MAIKAVCAVVELTPETASTFRVEVSFVSFPSGIGLSGHTDFVLSAGTPASVKSGVADGLKAYLESQGVTFLPADSVEVL